MIVYKDVKKDGTNLVFDLKVNVEERKGARLMMIQMQPLLMNRLRRELTVVCWRGQAAHPQRKGTQPCLISTVGMWVMTLLAHLAFGHHPADTQLFHLYCFLVLLNFYCSLQPFNRPFKVAMMIQREITSDPSGNMWMEIKGKRKFTKGFCRA